MRCTETNQGWLNATTQEMEQYETLAYDTALSTLVAVLVYVLLKVSVDGYRHWRARVKVLIVGSGPVGLTAALIAARSRKVQRLVLLEERCRTALLARPQQIALDPSSVRFLLGLGVDFDNMEGCWHNEHFFTKVGVFQEYVLSLLEKKKHEMDIQIHLGTKFTEEYLKKIPTCDLPRVIVVCDGSCGSSSSVLGVSSDYIVESCNAYGANAAIERTDQRQVPTPEIRAHSLYFDLSAYGIEFAASNKEVHSSEPSTLRPGSHLKIYGTFRNRYMALACPVSDSKVVKFLRHTPNSSIQEKCREQQMPLYIAFIDLTKAFDLVSRRGLFRLLEKIGCPPKLLSIITSFHDNMKGTIQHGGTSSDPFSYPEWRETGLCSRTHTLWDFLLPAAFTCVQVL
ncbi:uncharacterized protein si:dkey-234i14.6 isoform X2 [Heterodontus francisci]|uniref:uncharacterized protein si:dkey-234i14.6 isoform X2 n=1 Tax=Heterodontus francisci TaxID=7792 RepID=UPI00355C7DA5